LAPAICRHSFGGKTMAKNDSDLFDRLRQAGLRKQVAKTLSEISEGASKRALGAARSAVGELRSLAEEIERRLPSGGDTAGRGAKRVTQRTSAAAPTRKTAAAAGRRARAPSGQNKAKILESLKAGPKTASEIAKETGIGTGTVGSTLSKLATAGEVAKADRGYRLPQEPELEAQRRKEDAEDAREHPAEAAEQAHGAEHEHEQAQADTLEARRRAETSGQPPLPGGE
jgi:hypothetical protein